MNADKLASFRVDSDLWQQFQGYAKENNTNASALLVAYIKSVVNGTSNPVVNTSSEINNPTLSLQDIDKRIDDKIKSSIQNINIPSIQNIEDLIDARIASACRLGDIKDAIAICYADMMGNFNGLVSEIESIPPAAAPDDQLPIPCSQLPDIEKSTIENIRTTLSRKNIKVTAEQIRKAFKAAGWDGNNFNEIRKDILEILSGGDKK